MKKKYWIAGSVATVLLIAVVLILAGRKLQFTVPADIKVPDKIAEVISLPLPAKETKPVSKILPPVFHQASDAEEPVVYEYPVEQEEEFIEEAMRAMPSLNEVDVNEPGVVFFRHKPARPDAIAESMNNLAELYRTLLEYDKPVNVVFFISGRPMKSKVFFRE